MKRPVIWAAEAYRDTLAILSHIAEDDPDMADRIVDLIEAAGQGLGALSTGRPGRVKGTFEKSLAPSPGSCAIPWIGHPTRKAS
jgi:toxin ParE1/3/4